MYNPNVLKGKLSDLIWFPVSRERKILDDPTNYNEILVKHNEVSYKLRLDIQRPKCEEHESNWEAPRK